MTLSISGMHGPAGQDRRAAVIFLPKNSAKDGTIEHGPRGLMLLTSFPVG
jgi:hypothetical protein